MTCNLEKNKGVSVKSLPLGGEGASLQFITLAGSEPGQLAEHAELLQKAEKSGLRWIGPEVYGSADLDLSSVPGAGMTAFLGTKTGASFYRGMQICAVEGINARAIEFNGRTAGVFMRMNMPSMPFWAVCRPATGQPDGLSRHWMYSGRWKKR